LTRCLNILKLIKQKKTGNQKIIIIKKKSGKEYKVKLCSNQMQPNKGDIIVRWNSNSLFINICFLFFYFWFCIWLVVVFLCFSFLEFFFSFFPFSYGCTCDFVFVTRVVLLNHLLAFFIRARVHFTHFKNTPLSFTNQHTNLVRRTMNQMQNIFFLK